jgi:hypothetical protein
MLVFGRTVLYIIESDCTTTHLQLFSAIAATGHVLFADEIWMSLINLIDSAFRIVFD